MAGKKLRLVTNWRDAHTWASMWWSGFGFLASIADFLNEIWVSMDLHSQERFHYAGLIGTFLFGGTMVGRLLIWVHDHIEEVPDADNE